MKRTFFLLTILLSGCSLFKHRSTDQGLAIAPTSKSFILIDAGRTYTPAAVLKKKRVQVVKEVKNQYLMMVTNELQRQLRMNSNTDTTLSADVMKKIIDKDRTAIASLQSKYPDAIIFILKDCAGGFVNKGSRYKNGYSSIQYASFFNTDWLIIQGKSMEERSINTTGEYSPTQPLNLELRGPAYKDNKDDIIESAERNAKQLASLLKY